MINWIFCQHLKYLLMLGHDYHLIQLLVCICVCAHIHLPGLQRGCRKKTRFNQWVSGGDLCKLMVRPQVTGRDWLRGERKRRGLGLPLPLSAKVPHRYAILLCAWDVDDSLVGQLTKQRWHIAKLCFLYYMDADNLVGLPSPFYQTPVRSRQVPRLTCFWKWVGDPD